MDNEPFPLPPLRFLPAITAPLILVGEISIVGDRVAVRQRDVARAIIAAHAAAAHERPGGDCENCGVVRVTVEFFGS